MQKIIGIALLSLPVLKAFSQNNEQVLKKVTYSSRQLKRSPADTAVQGSIPNALAKEPLAKNKGNNGKGHNVYILKAGMKCIAPDSTYHSHMPV